MAYNYWVVDSHHLLKRLEHYIAVHIRRLSFVLGLASVLIWTLVRFVSNGINFDVVGQIVLARQWASGAHGGAVVGATNYLLKMPVYLLSEQLGFMTPRMRLLLLVVVFNVVTFIGIFLLLERIVKASRLVDRSWLYVGILWLATISGRVFWLDYPNSRNLEVLGGLAILCVALRLIDGWNVQRLIVLVVIASLTFFADPLQIYMVGLPLIVFVGLRVLRQRTPQRMRAAGQITGLLIVAYFVAKLLQKLATATLPVSFLAVPGGRPELTPLGLMQGLASSFHSTLRIFNADVLSPPYGASSIVGLIHLSTLAGFAVVIALAIRQRRLGRLGWLYLILTACDYAVYIGSGLSTVWATERYLIIIPVTAPLFIAAALQGRKLDGVDLAWPRRLVLAGLILTILGAAAALVMSIPTRYSKDSSSQAAANYVVHNGYQYAVGAREIAIPASYLANSQSTIIPLLCVVTNTGKYLLATNLFFDAQPWRMPDDSQPTIPLIVQSDGAISQAGVSCNQPDIIRQFGQPLRIDRTAAGAAVLIYPTAIVLKRVQ